MITRYDPFREALSLRRAMDQLFEQSFVHPSQMPSLPSLMVPMDVCETPDGYEVDVALPGARPEDIELTIDQNTLTIRGRYSHQGEHQKQPEGKMQGESSQQQSQPQVQQPPQQSGMHRHQHGHNWLLREIVSGSFERMITFSRPIDTNKVQTGFQNGILTILLPVSEASRPKRLSITSSESRSQPVAVGARQQ
jgi:HSP20 family protein